MLVTINLLNDNKLLNIMENKYSIKKLVRGRHCRDFAKQEFWKVGHVKLFLVKHNSTFGAGYYNRKNNIFRFMDVLSLTSF